MIKIKDIKIYWKKEFVYNLQNLVKEEQYFERGKRDFQARGFHNARDKVYSSIARTASHLDSNVAIIFEEHSNKRGFYSVKVSFYYDKSEERIAKGQ